MKCSFCGNELESGATFCPNCGTILSLDDTDTSENENYNEPVDIYSGSKDKTDDDEFKAPEYIPPVLEDKPLSAYKDVEEDDDDPFKEMHPDEESYISPKHDSQSDDDEDYEDDGEDMLVSGGKDKKKTIIVSVLVIVLIAVIAGGIYAVKNSSALPFISKTTDANASVNESSSDKETESTEEKTTKEKPTKEKPNKDKTTTEKASDEKDTTESTSKKEEPSEEPSATVPSTEEATKPTETSETVHTTAPTTASTTAPTTVPTTAPTTSAPTTAAPTTKPSVPTTVAPTTAPTTSAAPVNQLKKPSQTIAKFTVYATEDGVSLRYTPSTASARILYLSVGADLVVTGEENGFYYVYSNRYGVNGWVSKAYTSTKRPVAQTEQNVSGVVKPDSKGSGKTMYVNTTDGLRLRKGPGTNYGVIRMISNGYPVVVKGTSSSVSGWVYVTDTTHGVSGWVSSAYIK